MRFFRILISPALILAVCGAKGQDVPPPPRPADSAPSLEATMKFIQDKLNGQRGVWWLQIQRNFTEYSLKTGSEISKVLADAPTCTLSFKESLVFGSRRTADSYKFSFRDAEKLTVSSREETADRNLAKGGHPEAQVTTTPQVFDLTVYMTKGKSLQAHQTVYVDDIQHGENNNQAAMHVFVFETEETAQRVAKAMLHAIELCGGGSKDPFLRRGRILMLTEGSTIHI